MGTHEDAIEGGPKKCKWDELHKKKSVNSAAITQNRTEVSTELQE
jgi:hypothetical protein